MKKSLLKENTIRRFMKLASIGGPMTEKFVDNIEEKEVEKPKDDLEEIVDETTPDSRVDEAFPPEEEEPPMGDEEELGGEEDMMGDEEDMMGDEEDLGEPEALLPPEKVKELVDGIAQVVSDVTGVEVSAEGGEEDLGGEEELPPPPGEGEFPPPEEEEPPGNMDLYEDEDGLVAEITKRVSKRLAQRLQEKKKTELVDNLAEKIANKIFNSKTK